ncbi:hypothetical protein BOX15_Mlig004685g1 [Macrostomum lignano]|nr:hypothetical protein BOX15_Mlig004685g1 [Macrostomum lignano]
MKSTLATAIKGDPTTPMYPSKAFAVRSKFDPPPPSQPAIPISAADARQLRDFAKSSAAGSPRQLRRLRIRWPMRRGLLPIRDICTEVKGAVEPDRVVLLGGHRDAWHSGALDPHSGVSSLLVITRALAELQRTGWRPRRTLLACSWDAEEWNLIGSAEWLDEELRRADRRLVAYVNTDTDIMGNWKVMVHAFRRWRGFLDKLIDEVPNPDPNGDSRYHFYKTPDAYSDYYVFWRTLGVPIVDLSYIRPNETRMVVYDLYHSRYDTARLYRMIDPGGRAHLATVQNYLGIVYTLLDSAVLPGISPSSPRRSSTPWAGWLAKPGCRCGLEPRTNRLAGRPWRPSFDARCVAPDGRCAVSNLRRSSRCGGCGWTAARCRRIRLEPSCG